jgi:hypothetical protein
MNLVLYTGEELIALLKQSLSHKEGMNVDSRETKK